MPQKKFTSLTFKGLVTSNKPEKVKQSTKTLEFDVANKSGKTVPIEISISALQLEGKWHALATVRDCSERKAA